MSKKEEKRFNTVAATFIGILWIGIVAISYMDYKNISPYELFNEASSGIPSYQETIGEEISIPDVVDTPNSAEEVTTNQPELITLEICSKEEPISKYNIVKTIGNVEQRYVDAIEEELMLLPNLLVESFIENDWTLYITTENIAEKYLNRELSARGLCRRKYKTILIEARDDAIYTSTLKHEFGHYLEYICGKVAWTEEFTSIYYEEVNTFKARTNNPITVSDQGEFFAETFSYILNDQSKCTPKALEYVTYYMNLYLEIPDNEEIKFEVS